MFYQKLRWPLILAYQQTSSTLRLHSLSLDFRFSSSDEANQAKTEQVSSTSDLNRMDSIKVSATEKADSLDPKPVVFDNAELGNVVSQLAAFYHVKVELDNAESQHIRIFFNWDKTKTLKQNLEILNAFERIQITELDGTLKVE